MLQRHKALLFYLAKFFGVFFLLFYGTEGVIALSSPGNSYSPFVQNYLNFIDPFREFLLQSAKVVLSAFGFQTYLPDANTIALTGGKGVRLVYSCLGYGVLSFWIAFVFANRSGWKKKVAWIAGGCIALCAVNIARISIVLVAHNQSWPIPFGWDHHTWFNIVAYFLILYAACGGHFTKSIQEKDFSNPLETGRHPL